MGRRYRLCYNSFNQCYFHDVHIFHVLRSHCSAPFRLQAPQPTKCLTNHDVTIQGRTHILPDCVRLTSTFIHLSDSVCRGSSMANIPIMVTMLLHLDPAMNLMFSLPAVCVETVGSPYSLLIWTGSPELLLRRLSYVVSCVDSIDSTLVALMFSECSLV